MFRYRNGRLWVPGLSFALPEGFYIETDSGMMVDNRICLISPSEDFQISFQVYGAESTTHDELTALIAEMGFHTIQQPTPICTNGMHGHCAMYKPCKNSTEGGYFEARYNIPTQDTDMNRLVVIVQDLSMFDIEKIAQRDEVAWVLRNIRAEVNEIPEQE